MKDDTRAKLSTESYKGVRDFYPEDQAAQNHIFGVMRKTVESFGYQEYGASVLEPAELYRAKSGEEIVNEQTYTFVDRGDREVTLRPEMTPTVARMIAGKRRELAFPARWYSIPNLYRYEKPQRGRLREHWQLNVDLFGAAGIWAETEMIQIASSIMRNFGLKDSQFEIRVNSRKIINFILSEVFRLEPAGAHAVSKLIDRKDKMPTAEFELKLREIFPEENVRSFIELLNSKNFEEFVSHLPANASEHEGMIEVKDLLAKAESLGISNIRFDQTLMRGFDYYTGIVFEVFDLHPDNRRAVFGGGRYDGLTDLFEGGEPISAIGFGMGDVVIKDVLETYGILPGYRPTADLALCAMDESVLPGTYRLAEELRAKGVRVAINMTGRKIGDQFKWADKTKIPFAIVIGADEIASQKFAVKNLATGEAAECGADGIPAAISIK